MSRVWTNLIIKFVALAIVSALLLPRISNTSVWQAILMAAALTIISFTLGDAWVLPEFGNVSATLGDLAIAFFTVWILGSLARTNISFGDALLFGAIVAVAEYCFHAYMTGGFMKAKQAS